MSLGVRKEDQLEAALEAGGESALCWQYLYNVGEVGGTKSLYRDKSNLRLVLLMALLLLLR